MNNGGSTWPEQDAVEAWWRAHRYELKEAVTVYRLQEQKRLLARIGELEKGTMDKMRQSPEETLLGRMEEALTKQTGNPRARQARAALREVTDFFTELDWPGPAEALRHEMEKG